MAGTENASLGRRVDRRPSTSRRGQDREEEEEEDIVTPDVQLPGGRGASDGLRVSDYEELMQVNVALMAENRRLQRRVTQQQDPQLTAQLERDVQGLLEANLRAKERERKLEQELRARERELQAKERKLSQAAEELRASRASRVSPASSSDTRPTSVMSSSSGGSVPAFRSVRPASPRETQLCEDSLGIVQVLQEELRAAKMRASDLERELWRSRRGQEWGDGGAEGTERRSSLQLPRPRSNSDAGVQCLLQPTSSRESRQNIEAVRGRIRELEEDVETSTMQATSLREDLQTYKEECRKKDIVIRSLKALLPRAPSREGSDGRPASARRYQEGHASANRWLAAYDRSRSERSVERPVPHAVERSSTSPRVTIPSRGHSADRCQRSPEASRASHRTGMSSSPWSAAEARSSPFSSKGSLHRNTPPVSRPRDSPSQHPETRLDTRRWESTGSSPSSDRWAPVTVSPASRCGGLSEQRFPRHSRNEVHRSRLGNN
eukprot:Hpha_TRINITY_DN12760_c0_g1::TRINITY_DN12760_c0_g1_i1::g.114269::m.114269